MKQSSKLYVLFKAFGISLKVKGVFSVIITILGFGAVLLPVFMAQRLKILTDLLQSLSSGYYDIDQIYNVFTGIAVLFLLQLILDNSQSYINKLDNIKILHYLKKVIIKHKCEVSYKYIENYDDFQKRISLTEEYGGAHVAASIKNIVSILQSVLSLIIVSITLWQVHPLIVISLIITGIPAALLAFFQQDETIRGRAKWFEEGALAIHYYVTLCGYGSFDALQEIKHFALYDYMKARWRAVADEYTGKKNKIMAKHVKYNLLADFLRSVVYILILLITVWSIYKNPVLGLGTFTLVFALSGHMQSVTGDCLVNIMIMVQYIPYMKEFLYLDKLDRDIFYSNANIKNGDIEFKNVSFSYPNTDKLVLKDINIKIKDGEKIAVVGENGSGKSTFISLLCGMFDPSSGQIEINNIPVKNNTNIREAISVVFQDFAHYEATLRENITVSDKNKDVDNEKIMELLNKINVNDVVDDQPNGLDEIIGSFNEKANDLSGGQWQKISIARAAYKENAKIMILDEPTSALDPVAEAQLYRDFTGLTGDKTTLLISHRLGITAVVDRILVFHDGCIVEDGSHKELMKKNGYYAKMYMAQAQWYI